MAAGSLTSEVSSSSEELELLDEEEAESSSDSLLLLSGKGALIASFNCSAADSSPELSESDDDDEDEDEDEDDEEELLELLCETLALFFGLVCFPLDALLLLLEEESESELDEDDDEDEDEATFLFDDCFEGFCFELVPEESLSESLEESPEELGESEEEADLGSSAISMSESSDELELLSLLEVSDLSEVSCFMCVANIVFKSGTVFVVSTFFFCLNVFLAFLSVSKTRSVDSKPCVVKNCDIESSSTGFGGSARLLLDFAILKDLKNSAISEHVVRYDPETYFPLFVRKDDFTEKIFDT